MNIQHLAQEYKKLQAHKYFFGLANGEHINLKFLDENFYHLLGFHKFEDATIIKMIKDETYFKKRFYKDILKGKILFHETRVRLNNVAPYMDNGTFIELNNVEETDDLKMVLINRFPYFTYENIMMLFNSELIIIYDKNKAKSKSNIDAEKIFFKFMTAEGKNLNLFIKHSEEKNCEVPISFFLEEIINYYLLTELSGDKREQEKSKITYLAVQNIGDKEFLKYEVYWDRVRNNYSKKNSRNYIVERKLHNYFFDGINTIKSYIVQEEFLNSVEMRKNIIIQLNEIEEKIKVFELLQKYKKEPETDENIESAVILLDQFGIDVMIEGEPSFYSETSKDFLEKESKNLKNIISDVNNKIKIINKYLPLLHQLEKEEIIYVYKKFIANIHMYEDTFFLYLVNECRVLENILLPKEIEDIYKKYKKAP